MGFTPVILIHVLAASGAIVLGGITLFLRKGTANHRLLGRLWVALMLVAALVSFAIRTTGHYSWIHLLSIGTLAALGSTVYAAIKGRIAAHRRGMAMLYAGLVVAGLFTLLPGRRLGDLVWHAAGMI